MRQRCAAGTPSCMVLMGNVNQVAMQSSLNAGNSLRGKVVSSGQPILIFQTLSC